ncbi:hypothetical protein TTHERM_00649370 (macronuclear) [Tetrahymena thermophila SB210]|uniref:Uncharacterized protein n=1 Tax=Tetrahymena thermophila (strain SB210) TaxID=312017 RepID=I7MG15_TETTS|nr:hypothetical protein TTHERM_00649370 [Tetrahymena thermophila SB210]EAR84668.2 hypothetical protein TTHERM_00649370 [Tetrahymena thermophila SB210]|eukprot:XP_001032331.2 hypothetical protein TTHERM_00649370 [Tetrahymena thermophila SB210]
MSGLKEQSNTQQQQVVNNKSINLVEAKQNNQSQTKDSFNQGDQTKEKKVEINNNQNFMNYDDIQINKEDDEDKYILMELIAKKNSQLIDQPQIADLSAMKESKVSQGRVLSRQIENNSIASQQTQNTNNNNCQGFIDNNQPVLPSLSQLERRRYISTEIEQQSSNISSNNYMDTLAAQYTNTKSRYAARAAALGQGSVQSNSQTQNQEQSEKQQLQIGLQGINQQIQFKNPPPRSQVQYQSGLSSSQSLTVQRDFHIYYQIGSSNNTDSSKSYEDDTLMMNQDANEMVKVPIDEIQEDTTVQDAIQSAVCQINNYFSIQKANYRLEYDDSLYDMYLAKKNGEKKSLPALYPLEKMKKFSNSNMVLIPKDGSALKRLVLNGSPKKYKSNIMSDQKAPNRETIKEESFISNNQSPTNSYIFNQTNRNGSQSQNKTSSSFTGYPPQNNNNNPNTRKSMQSTITQKQTKIGNQEREGGDSEIISSPSKCFPFFCCMRGNGSSSNKQSSSQSNSSKKRSTIATS